MKAETRIFDPKSEFESRSKYVQKCNNGMKQYMERNLYQLVPSLIASG